MQSCHDWLNLLAALGGGNFYGSRTVTDVKVARRQRKNNPYSSSIKTKKIHRDRRRNANFIDLKCRARRF